MSKSDKVKSLNHVFLQEIALRKQQNGTWVVDRLATNRGVFELLPEVQEEFDSELVLKFVEYAKSRCWEDILDTIASGT